MSQSYLCDCESPITYTPPHGICYIKSAKSTFFIQCIDFLLANSPLEHRRNEEILEEAKVEPIAMVYEKENAGMVRAHQKKRRNSASPPSSK